MGEQKNVILSTPFKTSKKLYKIKKQIIDGNVKKLFTSKHGIGMSKRAPCNFNFRSICDPASMGLMTSMFAVMSMCAPETI